MDEAALDVRNWTTQPVLGEVDLCSEHLAPCASVDFTSARGRRGQGCTKNDQTWRRADPRISRGSAAGPRAVRRSVARTISWKCRRRAQGFGAQWRPRLERVPRDSARQADSPRPPDADRRDLAAGRTSAGIGRRRDREHRLKPPRNARRRRRGRHARRAAGRAGAQAVAIDHRDARGRPIAVRSTAGMPGRGRATGFRSTSSCATCTKRPRASTS